MLKMMWVRPLALATCGLLLAGLALAQQREQQGQQGQQGQQERQGQQTDQNQLQRFIQEYDKNQDGSLSQDELPPQMRNQFAQIDRNNDGKLNAQELQQHAARMQQQWRHQQGDFLYVMIFRAPTDPVTLEDLQQAYGLLRTLDQNNDGKLERQEIVDAREKVIEHRVNAWIRRLDQNNDNRISKEEAQGFLQQRFDQFDQNKDGFVDRNEFQKVYPVLTEDEEGGRTGTKDRTGTRDKDRDRPKRDDDRP